jgi:hypothetical protein
MKKPSRSRAWSGGCLSLFGLPFLIGGLVLTFLFFNGYRKWLETQSWVETPCWIETAKLEVKRNDGTTYKATATYRYDYQGKTFRGDRVSIYGGSDNVGDFQQEAYRELAQYAESLPDERNQRNVNQGNVAPFRCYVNPSAPEQAVIYRTLRWQLQAFMAIFALTFPAIGAGLVFGGFWASRELKDEEARKAEFPDQPWKWKKIWAENWIPEQSGPWQQAIHAYTLWSAAIIVPLILSTAMTGAFTREPYSWLLFIPLGLWLLPARKSWQAIRKKQAIRSVRLQLDKPYIEPGSLLSGEILFGREVSMPERANIQLVCEKKVTHESSDGSSTSREIVWSSDKEASPPHGFIRDFPVSRLPVSFAIPIRAKESSQAGDTEYLWKVTLDVPGTVINAVFEVPVFHSEASRTLAAASLDDDEGNDVALTNEQLQLHLLTNGIDIRFGADQRLQSLTSERARYRTFIGFGVFFSVIWSVIAVVLILSGAPLIFKLIWPLTSIGLWMLIAWQTLHRRLAIFEDRELTVIDEMGPWKWTRSIPRDGVIDVMTNVNMQAGATRYHQVQVKNTQGKKIAVVDGIIGETEANSVVKLILEWRA